MSNPKILCIDDEINNLEALERLLRKKYTVLKANSPTEGLNLLEQNHDITVIISDQKMPGMTGVELLEKSISTHPNCIRILLTGYTDIESVIEAINKGQIYRYITKPWEPMDLLNTVDHAIERFQIGIELEQKNKALEKAFEELSTLDKAKSNFMILINHELKTPLTSLINYSEILKETSLSDDQKKYLDRISQNTERLKKLIDDVLLIVKADTNSLKIDKTKQNFKLSLSELTKETQILISNKKQMLEFQWEDSSCNLDKKLIVDVLYRLIHNASKFGNEESTVFCGTKVLENNKIEFFVQNQGPSINEKTLNKIFNPFFIDEDILNHSTGMGLGLSIAQSLLKAHKSILKIENTPVGVRSSFILEQ